MIVIVGHGPSVLSGLGSVIDSHTVVRLKNGLTKQQPKEHFGTRTDYLCARSLVFDLGEYPFWHLRDDSHWHTHFKRFAPKRKKPSTGLCAVFCAIDQLNPKEIGFIGCDSLLNPDITPTKWDSSGPWAHDMHAENACLHSLGIEVIDFGEVRRF